MPDEEGPPQLPPPPPPPPIVEEPRTSFSSVSEVSPPISHQQETARKRLAYSLIAILAVEVVFACSALFISKRFELGIEVRDITEIMVVIFGPTVALVGSATGFYFGARTASDETAPRN